MTTADILSLRRRVMLLYRDIYTELGIYPETRAAILRSARPALAKNERSPFGR